MTPLLVVIMQNEPNSASADLTSEQEVELSVDIAPLEKSGQFD